MFNNEPEGSQTSPRASTRSLASLKAEEISGLSLGLGPMEKKMETTTVGLCRVKGSGFHCKSSRRCWFVVMRLRGLNMVWFTAICFQAGNYNHACLAVWGLLLQT